MKVYGHGTTTGIGSAINSRASFIELAALGVDGVELDVRRTADDQLVVIHDDSYASGAMVAATNADDRPEDVILLGEALDICRGLEVNIELKNLPREPSYDPDERISDVCATLLDDRGGADRVIVSSFGLGCIDRILEVRPDTPTALLLFSRRTADHVLDAEVSARHRVVHPYISMVDDAFVQRCAELDLAVNVWGNGEEDDDAILTLLSFGVDGLITELPEQAMRLRALHASADQ